MLPTTPHAADSAGRIAAAVRDTWGYSSLRPLQQEAIAAALDGRDSVVVMPTGGGKSLCYQVPPLIDGRLDVVVSPLISLMKDQVDGLRAVGYPAAALYSGQVGETRTWIQDELDAGRCRLLLISPERLLGDGMIRRLQALGARRFAIDEGHCISHWGHDFRPEYRRLGELRRQFPEASLHAFTATATQRVRDDIVQQLALRDPLLLVGSFDRPNLVYRVVPRDGVTPQTAEILNRHRGEAAIVYCISRRDTEELAGQLVARKFRAAAYHAGMSAEQRRRTQDAFTEEKLDVVVATVAFGMGIDRSDVRCVIHAAMPKSVEHYQQETGRAGRDGLPAECVLLYSPSDVVRWESLIEKSAGETEVDPAVIASTREHLRHMKQVASRPACRHRMLVEYFGQSLERDNCEACDVCLGEVKFGEDDRVTAQKILSCVARCGERFGGGHITDVLCGSMTDRVRQFRHDQLSTYALLKERTKKEITSLVHQLVDQGLLDRTTDEFPVLKLNAASWEVLRGRRPVHFTQREKREAETKLDRGSWEGVDRDLFEKLRGLRRRIAEGRGVPPYVIFHDSVLRDMARKRPTSIAKMREVFGIGKKRLDDLGQEFIGEIRKHVGDGVSGEESAATQPAESSAERRPAAAHAAAALFEQGASIEDVCRQLGRKPSTVAQYLEHYIVDRKPKRIDTWVDARTYERVAAAVEELGARPFAPIFESLGGEVPYEHIRLTIAHLETWATSASPAPDAES